MWFPTHDTRLDFEVKAKNDAHLMLTGGPSEEAPCYEIFLGGWGNSKCAIRLNKERPDVAEAEIQGAVNGDEFKKFWMKLSYAGIQVRIHFRMAYRPSLIASCFQGLSTFYSVIMQGRLHRQMRK
jgi:hypothetical protein